MYECSEKCPKCGGEVEWDFACHTYPQERDGKVTWMACMPCDSATEYRCVAHNEDRCYSDCEEYGMHEGCSWRWTWGLNSNNPRAAENELRNPRWDDNNI